VAVAGPDQTIECTGPEGALVTLDAGGSSDPDDDPLEYAWSGPFGTAAGASPTVTVPIGTWTITLTVTDPAGAVATDTVVVTVRDTVAPALLVRALPDRLWPPDGRLAQVFVGITTRDLCDPQPVVTLVSITSDDPRFDPDADVSGASYGTADRVVRLRAKRTGGIGGRLYTLSYTATDQSGNAATATTGVLVTQGQGK
ncbi:MAG TPA: PKD domain-containing protein, partial [Dongiaceae bacterium]|nr:PKD domain-containing protein [Dongiaceae bacterium]